MKQKNPPEEIFKKLKQKLDLGIKNRFELSAEDVEYLAAVILLELDKGKREGSLSKMDENYIESLKTKVEKRFFTGEDAYKEKSSESRIDKKI